MKTQKDGGARRYNERGFPFHLHLTFTSPSHSPIVARVPFPLHFSSPVTVVLSFIIGSMGMERSGEECCGRGGGGGVEGESG